MSLVKLYLAGGFAHYSDLVAPWQLRAQTSTLNGGVASHDIAWAGHFLGSRQDGWAWGGLVVVPPTLPAPTSPPPSGFSAAFGKESKWFARLPGRQQGLDGGTPALLGSSTGGQGSGVLGCLPLRCCLLWRQERLLLHDRRLLWICCSFLREQRRL